MPSTTIQEPNNNRLEGDQERSPCRQERRPSLAKSSRASDSSGCSNGTLEDNRLLQSNADYDHIRNSTLMFFLDRLYLASKEGQEPRTLHDLSCLFGTREFTKEMRQIVGASRNGLKKFLQSYPSLFTVDGEKVYLSQLKTDAVNPYQRDYNKEAIEYFTQKLLQFGTSLVPIRNLFGYRSQASQEVRHVSGKNTKEFKQFLGAHEDVFRILPDEHVVLVSTLRELEASGRLDLLQSNQLKSIDDYTQHQSNQEEPDQLHSLPALITNRDSANELPVMDPYLNKQFAHTLEDCLRRMCSTPGEAQTEMVSVESLHEKILQECQNELFLKMVKTINDLKLFLRMHPKMFKRSRDSAGSSEFVCLLTEEERRELELQAFPGSNLAAKSHQQQQQRQNSTLRRCDTNESNSSDQSNGQLVSLPNLGTANGRKAELQSTRSVESKSRQNYAGGFSLRASAPPFVPTSKIMANQQPIKSTKQQQMSSELAGKQNQEQRPPLQRSASSQPMGVPPTPTGNQREQYHYQNRHAGEQQSQCQRSATNQLQRSHSALKSTSQQPSGNQNKPPHYHQPVTRQLSAISADDDLRARTVNIVREASNIISRIMTTAEAVAFDCKGYNLGFNGQITLIQFGWVPKQLQPNTGHPHRLLSSDRQNQNASELAKQKPEVCIFDLITNPELAYCLKPLLESESIVKIVHDVRNKSNALHVQFDIMLNHVFDTQVANLVIQQQETGKPAYKSRYISMSKLCEIYGNESLAKYRNLIQSKTRHSGGPNSGSSSGKNSKDVNYWRTRPLTDAMVYESTIDVYSLVGGVYQNLKAKIKPEYKPLFDQLNLEGVLARIKPDEIRSVKKERKIDLEVIDLKRKLYSDTKSLIVLSNREIRLLRHIELTDEVRDKIQQCKKVAKKLERLDMKAAQLQSLQSQVSSGGGSAEAPSMEIQESITSSSSTSSSSLQNESLQNNPNNQEDTNLEEFGNLMNSSMFDELKDKMIDSSSSLIDSIKDDGDQVELVVSTMNRSAVLQSAKRSLDHSGSQCSSCGCNCHKDASIGSVSPGQPSPAETPVPEDQPSATSIILRNEQQPEPELSMKLEDTGNSRISPTSSSKAVDMAVQCDLLG